MVKDFVGELFEDDELWGRAQVGRFSAADERMMEQLVRGRASLWPSFGRGTHYPDLRTPGTFSSRPRSAEGGQTFNFRHRTVSKPFEAEVPRGRIYLRPKGDGSAPVRPAAEGARFDRRVRIDGRTGGWFVPEGKAVPKGLSVVSARDVSAAPRGMPLGTAAARQRYIERDGAVETGKDGVEVSVGNIADDPAGRAAFWRAVEGVERRDGRVQSTVVADLPYEEAVGAAGRRRIIEQFGAALGEMGLAWHGVSHPPDVHSDRRNYHMHLHYHDRPVAVRPEENPAGAWGFAAEKAPAPRAYGFVRSLRARFAEIVNKELDRARAGRRFDPRRYVEMGIAKKPTGHLGNAASALERSGVVTVAGRRNFAREAAWRRRAAAMRAAARFGDGMARLEAVQQLLGQAATVDRRAVTRARENVERAAVAFLEALDASVAARAREDAVSARADDLLRRPAAAAARGRGKDVRREGGVVAAAVKSWGDDERRRAARDQATAGAQERKARRELGARVADLRAELLLASRERALAELAMMAGGVDGKVSAAALRHKESSLEREAEALERERARLTEVLDGHARALGCDPAPVASAAHNLRRWRRDLRRILDGARIERVSGYEDGAGQVVAGGALRDPGDGEAPRAQVAAALLSGLDAVYRRLAEVKGSLARHRRLERARRRAGQVREVDDEKALAVLMRAVRRRLDGIDREIASTPAAMALARARGLEKRLGQEGDAARSGQRGAGRDA